MDADDYDPRKPENIIPASEDEVQRQNSELRQRQMEKLETLIEKQANSPPKAFQHYEQVLAEMRSAEGHPRSPAVGGHLRMRSTPAGQATSEAALPPANFTHARVHSAPTRSSSDSVPPEDSAHANFVHGSTVHHRPGDHLHIKIGIIETSRGTHSASRVTSATGVGSRIKLGVVPPTGFTQRRRPPTPQALAPRATVVRKPQQASVMAMCMGRGVLEESKKLG